ncbi:hypothetical protein CBS101457_001318 [Exobasidium rhododendri]|nr:hypothetical protein CBS101457_001318 [Exobasidium rhododendri]
MANGDKIRQILGHEDSRKSVIRELQEISVGASDEFVEARTSHLLREGNGGQQNTCDDLPAPPTGYNNGELVYDGDHEVVALIDVIGLLGPETLITAKALMVERAVPVAAPTSNGGTAHQELSASQQTLKESEPPEAKAALAPKAAVNGTAETQPQKALVRSANPAPAPRMKEERVSIRSKPPKSKAIGTMYADESIKGSFFQTIKLKMYR